MKFSTLFVLALTYTTLASAQAQNPSDFRSKNADDAEKLQNSFKNLNENSPCKEGDQACVKNQFAQCVNGKFALTPCAGGLECAALPLVNKPGTSIACTTEADRQARLADARGGNPKNVGKGNDNVVNDPTKNPDGQPDNKPKKKKSKKPKNAQDLKEPGNQPKGKDGQEQKVPKANDPNVNDPNVNDPNVNDPNVNDPKVKDPKTKDPKTKDPKTKDPKTKDPKTKDPKTKDPKTKDPKVKDPKTKDPNVKDPNVNDPNVKDPKTNDPKANDPNNGAKPKANDPNNGAKPKANDPTGNIADIRKQNADDAENLQKQFDKLDGNSPCKNNEQACVKKQFAQCVNGKFALNSCGNGLECAALPLVLKSGTSITCTTEADRLARIDQARKNL